MHMTQLLSMLAFLEITFLRIVISPQLQSAGVRGCPTEGCFRNATSIITDKSIYKIKYALETKIKSRYVITLIT